MLTRVERNNLEQYYDRTYSGGLLTRMVSLTGVAAVTTVLGVWPPWAAGLWLACYIAGELGLTYYWSRVRSRLQTATLAYITHVKLMLMGISGAVVAVGAVPFLLTPGHGTAAAALGVLVSSAALMTVAAQHSLSPRMFWFTAPMMAVVLQLNIYQLTEGPPRWMLLILGVGFLINCWRLQGANAIAYSQLIRTTVDADLASKAKSTFLATMSHEIRTPLNGVLGMAQAMSLDKLEPAQRQRLAVVQSSGEALLAILDDLLDLSKIEAGRIEIAQDDFDLTDTIISACHVYHSILEEKGVRLIIDTARINGVFRGDAGRIRQIIQNLVSNAVKFTAFGAITVVGERTVDGVRISVTDTGIGISDEGRAALFTEFSQVDQANTRRYGGTGLGLAIVRNLARLMGGEIEVESRLGEGARFTVTLPLAWVRPQGGAGAGIDLATSSPTGDIATPLSFDTRLMTGAPLRLLVAEDNPTNQMILRSILEFAHVDCFYVENGRDAVAAWSRDHWDLVLMDVQMPVMDGLDATRAIRQREQADGRTATLIYAMTADVMFHQVSEHRAAGMDGHIGKPLQVRVLFDLLSEIGARRAAAE
jgi:signal transduction histidine kinase